MLLSRAIIIACLTVLKYLFWLVTILLGLLIIRQYFLGPNGGASMLQLFELSMAAFVSGWVCRFFARRFERGI